MSTEQQAKQTVWIVSNFVDSAEVFSTGEKAEAFAADVGWHIEEYTVDRAVGYRDCRVWHATVSVSKPEISWGFPVSHQLAHPERALACIDRDEAFGTVMRSKSPISYQHAIATAREAIRRLNEAGEDTQNGFMITIGVDEVAIPTETPAGPAADSGSAALSDRPQGDGSPTSRVDEGPQG